MFLAVYLLNLIALLAAKSGAKQLTTLTDLSINATEKGPPARSEVPRVRATK